MIARWGPDRLSSMRRRHNRRGRNPALGMGARITRRDFLNGVSVAVGGSIAGGLLPGLAMPGRAAAAAPQDKAGYYPPALTGLRGSHVGSFEVAHSLRDGSVWSQSGKITDTGERYDLVVVGGGISGLSAAYFYRAGSPRRARSSFSTTMMISAAMPSATSFSSAAACS